MSLPNKQIREILLRQEGTQKEKIEEAFKLAEEGELSLERVLKEREVFTDERYGVAMARGLGVPYVNLSKLTIPDDVARIIPPKVARRHKAIAFERSAEGVKVAMADPTNATLLSLVARKTGERAIPHYATEDDLKRVTRLYKEVLQKTIDTLLKEDVQRSGGVSVLDEAPIAKIVDELVRAAYDDRASDIHIEPEEKRSLIRFRIDGVLQDVLIIPSLLHGRIVSRVKVLSNLRTDEHMSAQDGKMTVKLEEENLDIRVSIIPVTEGEKTVLRLLSSKSREFTLSDLGMSEGDLEKVSKAYTKSYGMILSTGPTGSGKTTSIYAILKILNTREKNITTIEDPVEYKIHGANQIQVNTKTNLTFAKGLRSILRQDPNIIFVGEIRDSKTAGIAVNASLTGHLVLSTLHTNDAGTAIPRLVDMKIEPFLVASTVKVIIAQRLVRKICNTCKIEDTISKEEIAKHINTELIDKYLVESGKVKTFKGKGCRVCHSTGYFGRIGIFEVLEVSKNIRKLVIERVDAETIESAARKEGMKNMMEDGLEKVSKGLTTIEEVMRATKVDI